jgi:hypothetical protein
MNTLARVGRSVRVVRDDGYRIQRFLEILRKHGMHNVHEARIRLSGAIPSSNKREPSL